jgi:hypothetical protein
MAQISRPFQIALAAVALLALLWVVALHRPGSGSSSSSEHATPPAASHSAAQGSSSASGGSPSSGAGSSVYHGSAPGVEGLTKAIAKAHGAVATSQQNAKQLQEKAAQASENAAAGTAASQHGATAGQHGTATSRQGAASAAQPSAGARSTARESTHPSARARSGPEAATRAVARQHAVEAQLARGKIVAVLFWSAKGSDDVVVRNALRALAGHDRGLAVQLASAREVASFGTVTRGVQVNGTPTLLLVGAHGKTRVLTGLQDPYAIEQAVSQLRHP